MCATLLSISFCCSVVLCFVFASYWSDLAFNVCLKCRNEYKVHNIVCNLTVRCEYVAVVAAAAAATAIVSAPAPAPAHSLLF